MLPLLMDQDVLWREAKVAVSPECHLELFWSYLTHPGSLTELLFFLFELSFVYNWYSYGQQLLQSQGIQ